MRSFRGAFPAQSPLKTLFQRDVPQFFRLFRGGHFSPKSAPLQNSKFYLPVSFIKGGKNNDFFEFLSIFQFVSDVVFWPIVTRKFYLLHFTKLRRFSGDGCKRFPFVDNAQKYTQNFYILTNRFLQKNRVFLTRRPFVFLTVFPYFSWQSAKGGL